MRESAAQGYTAQDTIEADGGRAEPVKHVSFSDVARAHFKWDGATEGAESAHARGDFQEKLAQFEQHSGVEIVDAYWCQRQASAVALARARVDTNGRLGFLRRALRQQDAPDFRLYRVTDWVTRDVRKLADLLHECDVLAIKAIWGLEGIQRAVVMQWLLTVEAHVLGFLEGDWKRDQELRANAGESDAGRVRRTREATATELDRLHTRVLRELSKIEDYYQEAGQKRARLRYVEGMLVIGVPAVALVAVACGFILGIFGLFDPEAAGVRRFYACMAAGAVGAIVSVVIRMSGRGGGFTIDHELGSAGVMQLGALRPLIGAVFGVVIALLIQTFLVPIDPKSLSFELFVVVAFLAGFSERWAKVMLEGAMRTIEKVDDAPDDGKVEPPPPAPVRPE